MEKYRKQLITCLFNLSQKWYTRLFKHHNGWQTTKEQLLNHRDGTLGNALGHFLLKNGFHLIPKVERHDAYHVLTGYGTAVEDEIALQYLCYGNGKRSPYLIGAVVLGTVVLPDYLDYYLKSYLRGRRAFPFHHYDYEQLLDCPLTTLRTIFFGWDKSLIHKNK